MTVSSTPPSKNSPIRIFGFLIFVVFVAIVLIMLPNWITPVLLGMMLLLSVLYGAHVIQRDKLTLPIYFKNTLLGKIAGVTGFVCILLASWQLHPTQSFFNIWYAFPVLILGGMSCVYSWWALLPSTDEAEFSSPESTPSPIRWRIVIIGGLCILTVAQIQLFEMPLFPLLTSHLQMSLQLTGMALIVWGFSGIRFAWRLPHINLKIDWLAVGVVIIAFALRIIDIETSITRLIDEANFATAVDRLSRGNPPLWLPFGDITRFSWVFPYTQYVAIQIFEPSLFALRIPSIILGTLQVWGMMAITSLSINRRAGLLVGLAVATFPPHLHYSRIGLNNIGEPTFAIFAFYFLIRGIREQKQGYFALSGVMLGMTNFSYEAGRLFFPPFMLALLVWYGILHYFNRAIPFPSRRQIGILLASALFVIVPFYYVWWAIGEPFFPRLEMIGGTGSFLAHGWDIFSYGLDAHPSSYINHFLHFMYFPTDEIFYGNHPYLLWITVPFFLFGWVYVLRRWNTLWGGLFFWWMLGSLTAIVFLGQKPQSPRFVIGLSVMGSLIGTGGYALIMWLSHIIRWRYWSRLVSAVVACICLIQGAYYFVHYVPTYYETHFYDILGENGLPTHDIEAMAFRAVDLPLNTQVIVINQDFYNPYNVGVTLRYFNRHKTLSIDYIRTGEFDPRSLSELDTSQPLAFFIEPNDRETFFHIRNAFPKLRDHESNAMITNRNEELALYIAIP